MCIIIANAGQRIPQPRFRTSIPSSQGGPIRNNIDGITEAELRRFSLMRGENPYADINDIGIV